jgi:hypothetical protein
MQFLSFFHSAPVLLKPCSCLPYAIHVPRHSAPDILTSALDFVLFSTVSSCHLGHPAPFLRTFCCRLLYTLHFTLFSLHFHSLHSASVLSMYIQILLSSHAYFQSCPLFNPIRHCTLFSLLLTSSPRSPVLLTHKSCPPYTQLLSSLHTSPVLLTHNSCPPYTQLLSYLHTTPVLLTHNSCPPYTQLLSSLHTTPVLLTHNSCPPYTQLLSSLHTTPVLLTHNSCPPYT